MYRVSSFNRVVKFLRKHKSCMISQLCYLGHVKMQLKYPTVLDIVDDLKSRKLVTVEVLRFGKRNYFRIVWSGKYGK